MKNNIQNLLSLIDEKLDEIFQEIEVNIDCQDNKILIKIKDLYDYITFSEILINNKIIEGNLKIEDFRFLSTIDELINEFTEITDLDKDFEINFSISLDLNDFPNNSSLTFISNDILWNIQNKIFYKNLKINLFYKNLISFDYYCKIDNDNNQDYETYQHLTKKIENKELINYTIQEKLNLKNKIIKIYAPNSNEYIENIKSLKYSYIDIHENPLAYNKLPKELNIPEENIYNENDIYNILFYYFQVSIYFKILDIFIFSLKQSLNYCNHNFFNRSFKLQLRKLDSKKLHDKIDTKTIKSINKNIKIIESYKNSIEPFNFNLKLENDNKLNLNDKLNDLNKKIEELYQIIANQNIQNNLSFISEYLKIKDNKITLSNIPYGFNLLNFNCVRINLKIIENNVEKIAYIDVPVSLDITDPSGKTFILNTNRDFNEEICHVQYLTKK